MLEIRRGNDRLDLGSYSVNFELKSPLFNDEGSFSYPFTLPPTSKNKRLLGHPARINNNLDPESGTWDTYLKGQYWKKAGLEVKDSNRDYIKIYLTLDEGDLRSRIGETKISDVDLGGSRNVADYSGPGANDIFSKAYEGLFPDQDFTLFELRNYDFYKDSDYDEAFKLGGGYVNVYDKDLRMNVEKNTYIPFVYLNYLVNRIFSHLNQHLKFNYFTTVDELRQMVIYNNVGVNSYFQDGEVINILKNDSFNLKDHLPDMTVKEFLNTIEKTFSVYLFRNQFTDEVRLMRFQDILTNPAVNEITQPYRKLKIEPRTWDGYALEWNHDGNDKMRDGGLYGFDPKSIDISAFNFKGNRASAVGLTGTGDRGDCWYLENTNQYAVKEYKYEGGVWGLFWNYYKANGYCDFTEGNGNLKITPQSSLIGTEALQEGNIDDAPFDYKDFALRFLLFRGMVDHTSPGGNYLKPYGSAFSTFSVTPIWNHGLQWHGSTGIYENFWKKPVDFYRNTRYGEFRMTPDVSWLRNLDFIEKQRLENTNWLLDTVKIQVTNDKISPAEITAWKV